VRDPRHSSPAAPLRLAAAFALGLGLALILTACGASRPSAPAATRAPAPARDRARDSARATFAHTPAGAAAAATAWCQTTTEAFIAGGWDRAVNALTVNPFRALAERYQPAAAMVATRLAAAHRPYALRLWPLGYQVQRYSPTAARVRVWQLYVLAIAAPEADTEFATTTVTLTWADGGWKVTAAPSGADLSPPPDDAATSQVAAWVRTVSRLREYEYVP